LALVLMRDLREHRVPPSAAELAGFETEVLCTVAHHVNQFIR